MTAEVRNTSDPLFADQIDFRDLLFRIRKRKWIALLIAILVPLMAAAYLAPLPWKYTATSRLLIDATPQNVISIDDLDAENARRNKEFVRTGAELIVSTQILEQVVRNLDLVNHWAFDPRNKKPPWYKRVIADVLSGEKPQPPKTTVEPRKLASSLASNVNVSPVRRSQLVEVSVTTVDPDLSAAVANEIVRVFIDTERERRMETAKQASDWLTQRLRDLKRQLEDAQETLRAYLSDKPLSYYETLPEVMSNPVVQRFQEAEADARRQISELKKRYGPEHPNMVAAEAELEARRVNLEREIRKVARAVAAKVGGGKETGTNAGTESAANSDPRLHALEREVITNRQLYDLFVNRAKETNLLQEMARDNVRIIDMAVRPDRPSGPRKTIYLMISVVAGICAALGTAIFVEGLNNALLSPEQVENKLGIPVLGIVPELKQGVFSMGQHEPARDSQVHSDTIFAEAIRNLRTAVRLSLPDQDKIAVLVTSSVELEGKTTLAINLALSIGQFEGRALLVDADLRRPAVAARLGLEPTSNGFSDFVAGLAPLKSCICTPQSGPQIDIMTAGNRVPNPQELLSSSRTSKAWNYLREQYQYIIIDSAPVLPVADTLFIADKVDLVALAIRSGSTPYQAGSQAVEKLRRSRSEAIYAILNRTDLKKLPGYYRYGYYDGYGLNYSQT